MKSILTKISFMFLTMLSFSSFAVDKVTITGTPVMLEQREGMYYMPSDNTETTTLPYHYVTLANDPKSKVCYAERQTSYGTDLSVKVNMGGKTADWYCYDATNTEYFVVTP